MKQGKKLGEIIVEAGLVKPSDIEEALQAQKIFGDLLGTNLIEMNLLSDDTLADFLSKQFQVPRATRQELETVSEVALNLIPCRAAYRLGILPLSVQEDEFILAMLNPGNEKMIERLIHNLNLSIEPRVVTEIELRYYLNKYYGVPKEPRFSAMVQQLIHPEGFSKSLSFHHQLEALVSTQEATQFFFDVIQTLEKIPVKNKDLDLMQLTCPSECKFLLLQIDGISSLEEIIANSPYSRMATLRSMVYFAKKEWIFFENS